jgi:RNA polymerase sigma-70 factor (ECF subfamily)
MTAMTFEAPSMILMAPKDITVARQSAATIQYSTQNLDTSSEDTLQIATLSKVGADIQTKSEPTDEELISAICKGQEFAIEILYDRYHRYVYALAYRMLHDSQAAEDIVQDAFLSIWRKASSYKAQHGSVHSWIQAIVHHRAIDKVRAAAHRELQWTPLLTDNEQDSLSEQPDVWEQTWQGEQHRIIRSVLDQIPAEQRMVIELAYFGGYTHAEISEQFHIPLGTVKGRMRLGLQKMKILLSEQGLNMI